MTKPEIDFGVIFFTTRAGQRLACPVDFGGLVDVDAVEQEAVGTPATVDALDVREVHHHHYAAQPVDFVSLARTVETVRPTVGSTLLPVVPALAAVVITFAIVVLSQWAVPRVGDRLAQPASAIESAAK